MPNFFYFLSIGLFVFICLFLILLVLIQKGRGGGLSAAFSGGGGSSAFGPKTGDVLTWMTATLFLLFLILAITLNLLTDRHQHSASQTDAQLTGSPNTAR